MANSKPVQSKEVVVEGVYDPLIANAKEALKVLGDLKTGLRKAHKAQAEILKVQSDPKTAKAIRDRDTGTVIWDEKFESKGELSEKVRINVSRILDLASGKAIPKPTDKKTRCEAFRYLNHCTYRI